ncbi:MAG: hypothetical protein Fur0023_11840 [Bacteroidia bacterium]
MREKILILDYETNMSELQQGNLISELVKIEVEKLNRFDIIDRNDAMYLSKKRNVIINECYGNLCLFEIGKNLETDKVIGGSVKNFGNKIVCAFRILNVKTGSSEKSEVIEFLPIKEEVSQMIHLTVQKLFGNNVDEVLLTRLTKLSVIENEVTNPNVSRLRLDGPRIGAVYFTGLHGKILRMSDHQGGYNVFPLMYQFGYQFEVQYFTSGKWQALFEFVPLITGLDQNNFFPSMTIMNGLRHNINGFELGIGPTFGLAKYAKGYYDSTGVWRLDNYWYETHPNYIGANPYNIEERLDSRGYVKLVTGVVVAIGKTFRSGKLNIPVNLYVIPSPNGTRFGISFGYNSKG